MLGGTKPPVMRIPQGSESQIHKAASHEMVTLGSTGTDLGIESDFPHCNV